MKVIGKVTETILVQKEIEIEVPDSIVEQAKEGDDDACGVINDAVRKAAYEKNLLDYEDEHGWEGLGTLDVELEWKEKDE